MAQEAETRLCINLEGWMGRETGGKFKREGIYADLYLIQVEVRHKTIKLGGAIILQ